ncbi:MAG: non-homologous end-joining DNA ligase [Ilumatobacteraceae bacterium]
MSLRFPVAPMKATMGSLPPVEAEGAGDEWAFEIKWDGYRTIAHVDGGAVRLQSSSGRDVTARWPEISPLAGALNAPSAILDGELVVLDDAGRPNFGHLQQSGVGSRFQTALYLFDVLQVNGTDTIDLDYLDRRRLLEGLVEPGDNWAVPSFNVGGGAALVAATAEQGLEGVIAKRVESRYRPGTRTKEWRKIKNRQRTTLTIGGFTAGTGNRSSTFGALLVGRRGDDGALDFAGGVGTGFDQRTLEELTGRLRAAEIDDCPFDPPPPASVRRTARWVEPTLDAEIDIAEFTNDGLVRHASFTRLV